MATPGELDVQGTLAPGVPPDYYDRIFDVEQTHWWFRGIRKVTAALLGDYLRRPRQRLLDAGCGTGGFLRWALDLGSFQAAAGVDISSVAIELARQRVPEATFDVAPLWTLPHKDDMFDLIVMNDVLQHIPEDHVLKTLVELRRTLAPGAALLVRTNGSRKLRRERDDWRAYDASSLRKALADGGFHVRRLTYANLTLSAWGQLRGRIPHAPTEDQHGIPTDPGRLRSTIGFATLRGEARLLAHSRARLPFGHTLFALAVVPPCHEDRAASASG